MKNTSGGIRNRAKKYAGRGFRRLPAVAVLSMVLALSAAGCKEDAPEYEIPEYPDVRNAAWNMTMDEVIFCEGRQPDDKSDNALLYKGVKMEKIPEADIEYKFYNIDLVNTDGTEKLLSSVVYSFPGAQKLEERQLHNSYIDVAAEYTKKYGDSISDERVTELTDNGTAEGTTLYRLADPVYDTNFTFGGTAQYVTEWVNEAETTNIRLKLTYDSSGGAMEVMYEYIEPNNDI
jgi:hypothetical protein